MKKILLISWVSLCLAACHCSTRCQAPRTEPAPVSAETSSPVAQHAQLLSVEHTPSPTTALPPSEQPLSTATNTQMSPDIQPAKTGYATLQTKPEDSPAQETTPTPDPAPALIAQIRARQTTQTPVTDVAVFPKEEILSAQSRLLNPYVYEPLQPDTTAAPWSNESLQFGVYYSFIKAGTAYIKARGITRIDGKDAYLVQTTAFSSSAIAKVFNVRDINYSWLEVENLHSLGYSQSLREGSYKRDEWTIFDVPAGHFYGEIQKKEEPHSFSGPLNQPVLDILSALYFVRAQTLQPGNDIVFDIINRETQYPLVVKVLGKETVKTHAGKFDCWVVEPQFRGEGIFVAKGKSLKVWLTDDKYKMPVKMSVEVFIGSVTAELLAYQRN